MLRRISFFIISILFIINSCQYFSLMNYKEWYDKNNNNNSSDDSGDSDNSDDSEKSPEFVFENGKVVTTKTLINDIKTVATVGNITSTPASLQGRNVYLSDFYIGKYEVTYEQWTEVYTWALSNGYNFAHAGSGSAGYPVVEISWNDVMVWCNALSEKEGLTPCYTYSSNVIRNSSDITACDNSMLTITNSGYRLPTEAEWEYAARGGALSKNYTFPGSNDRNQSGWYTVNSGVLIKPVGGKIANELGLYDMYGNVWEKCTDWYGTITTGITETNPTGPVSGSNRSRVGESFTNDDTTFSSPYDHRNISLPTGINDDTGFRVARTKTE